MSLFFMGDTHLGHDAIRIHCHRPFASVEEMDETILQNIRAMVTNRDELIIVGDLAWRDHARYIGRIPGKKTFIFGNHDKMSGDALRLFTRVVGRKNEPGIMHTTIDGKFVVVCHFPLLSWNAAYHGSWHIHGHCHNRLVEDEATLRTDCGIDGNNFFPWRWEKLKEKLNGREALWQKTRRDPGSGREAVDMPEG